jgi:hypothetical protein
LGTTAFTTTFVELVLVALPSRSVGFLVSTYVALRTVAPAVAAVPDPRTARSSMTGRPRSRIK